MNLVETELKAMVGKTVPGDITEAELNARFGGNVRVLSETTIITMEYVEGRVTFWTDRSGTITDVTTG
jgi:hypothetical protein